MANLKTFISHIKNKALANGFKSFHFGFLNEVNWKNVTNKEWPLFLLVIPDSNFTLQELLNGNAQQNYQFTILYLDKYRDQQETGRVDKYMELDNKFISTIKATFSDDNVLNYSPVSNFTIERFLDVGTKKAIGGSTEINVIINEEC